MLKVVGSLAVLAALAFGGWSLVDRGSCKGEGGRCEGDGEVRQWSGHRYVPPHRVQSVFFVDVSGDQSERPQSTPKTARPVSSGVQSNPHLSGN